MTQSDKSEMEFNHLLHAAYASEYLKTIFAKVPTERERAIRGEGGRPPQDTPCSLGRPSPYTLEMDAARLRALETYSGCDAPEEE